MAKFAGVASKVQYLASTANVAESVLKTKVSAKVNHKTTVDPTNRISKMQSREEQKRVPLKAVVADCEQRWFQDTLKEARSGVTESQFLLAQMYSNGYGVPKDKQKSYEWFKRARKHRSQIGGSILSKQPGFRASDSNSDDPRCSKGSK